MNKKIKVLCFTDDTVGRDTEMLLPIRYFAERFLNCEFHHALNIDIHQIYRIKPDVILQANTVGSNLYFEISQIAHKQNIPLFALISEGNFRTDGTFNIWGFNYDKIFYQDYVCAWSKPTADYLKAHVPEAANKIVLTGGVGFDRYTIYKFMQKEDFLRKYNKQQYKKVIGYAGWAFGKLEYKRGIKELTSFFKGDSSKLEWVEVQRKKIKELLEEAIVNNPDILFILKQHPHESAPERPEPVHNEMSELQYYENVIYLCTEESIHDLINISDIWTCFESTTSLEGWLMGKQTIFINPDMNFEREPVYTGSAVASSYIKYQEMINEYYSSGKVINFFDPIKEKKRKELIKDIIGFGDGLNHIRAASYFKRTVNRVHEENHQPVYKFHLWHWMVFVLVRFAGPFYKRALYSRLYKIKKHLWVFENYKMDKLHSLYKNYIPFFDEFYRKNQIEKHFLNKELFDKIIK
jgi:hypothetical protein